MIKYTINQNIDNVYSIEVLGHANYANHGNDIVCSSVSTALVMTANLIERLNLSYNIIELICEDGNFKLVIKLENDLVKTILLNLEETLKELEIQFPKHIKIRK